MVKIQKFQAAKSPVQPYTFIIESLKCEGVGAQKLTNKLTKEEMSVQLTDRGTIIEINVDKF